MTRLQPDCRLPARVLPSPNHGERKGGRRPDMLLLHYTGMANAAAAIRRLKADPAVREAIRKRLRYGLTVVTTDEKADARTRSAEGFVVLDSSEV